MPSSISSIHTHPVNCSVHVDHGGRSQSPHSSRPGSNCRSTSPRCRQTDPESFRALSNNCANKLMERKDQDDANRVLYDKAAGLHSSLVSEVDDIDGFTKQTSFSLKTVTSPPEGTSVESSTIIKQKSADSRRAAGPVSIRSTPTTPLRPYTLQTPPSKSSVQSMSPISPLASSPMNIPGRINNLSTHQLLKSSATVNFENALSTPVKNGASTRVGPNLRIETTPSSGTPGSRKAAAAPVSVRSTNKLPEKRIEPPNFGSNNSSPRSCPDSTNATPRHSNVVILGSSASGKKSSPNSVCSSGSRGSKENALPISPKESSLSRTFSRGKEAFFGKGLTRGVLGKHSNPLESYHSSNSIDSEETDSGKYLRFNPKFTPKYIDSNNSSSSDINEYKRECSRDDTRSNALPSSKKNLEDRLKIVEALNSDLPSGIRVNKVSSSNKIVKDKKSNDVNGGTNVINKAINNMRENSEKSADVKLKNKKNVTKSSSSSSSTTPEQIIKKSIATSVSSLWAFASELSNSNEKVNNNDCIIEDIEIDKKMNINNKNKPNRMTAEAIAGAIARQGGKVSAPFNSKFLTAFTNPNSNYNNVKNDNNNNNNNNNSSSSCNNNNNNSISYDKNGNNNDNHNNNNNNSHMNNNNNNNAGAVTLGKMTSGNLAKASASASLSISANTIQIQNSPKDTFSDNFMKSKNCLDLPDHSFSSRDAPRRRRSSAPTIASDVTSDTSEDVQRFHTNYENNNSNCRNGSGTGTTTGITTPSSMIINPKRIGTRTQKSGRAVSLPTIPSNAKNDGYHHTFISSLWNLSSELSDPEKDGFDTSTRHTSSNTNTSL